MHIESILRGLQPLPGFVYAKAEWAGSKARPALLVHVRPRKGTRAVCSGCCKKRPGYDTLDERRFLERVRSHGAQVDADQLAQPTALVAREVLRTLEQQPPRSTSARSCVRRTLARSLARSARRYVTVRASEPRSPFRRAGGHRSVRPHGQTANAGAVGVDHRGVRALGKTAEEFYARRDMRPATLKWWRWQLGSARASRRPERVQLVAVDVSGDATGTFGAASRSVLVAVSGVDVRVEVGTDVGYVAELVAALRTRC